MENQQQPAVNDQHQLDADQSHPILHEPAPNDVMLPEDARKAHGDVVQRASAIAGIPATRYDARATLAAVITSVTRGARRAVVNVRPHKHSSPLTLDVPNEAIPDDVKVGQAATLHLEIHPTAAGALVTDNAVVADPVARDPETGDVVPAHVPTATSPQTLP